MARVVQGRGVVEDARYPDPFYPNQLQEDSFSDLSYQDTGGVHPPRSHSGLQSIMPHDLGQNWRQNNAINYGGTYPQAPFQPNMLDVAGTGQLPAGGITATNEAQKNGWLKNLMDNTMFGKVAAGFDATNPRAFNYNPALQGQIDFLQDKGAYGVMDQSGLNKITGGTLAGKNLQSMFGTNDLQQMYEDQIGKYEKTYANLDEQWGNTLNEEELAAKKAAYMDKFLNPAKLQHQELLANIQLEEKKKADAAAAAAKAAYQGPITHDFDPKQGGGGRPDMSGATGTRAGGFTNPGKGAYGPWSAQGGYMTGHTRSRYSRGGRVGILSVF